MFTHDLPLCGSNNCEQSAGKRLPSHRARHLDGVVVARSREHDALELNVNTHSAGAPTTTTITWPWQRYALLNVLARLSEQATPSRSRLEAQEPTRPVTDSSRASKQSLSGSASCLAPTLSRVFQVALAQKEPSSRIHKIERRASVSGTGGNAPLRRGGGGRDIATAPRCSNNACVSTSLPGNSPGRWPTRPPCKVNTRVLRCVGSAFEFLQRARSGFLVFGFSCSPRGYSAT